MLGRTSRAGVRHSCSRALGSMLWLRPRHESVGDPQQQLTLALTAKPRLPASNREATVKEMCHKGLLFNSGQWSTETSSSVSAGDTQAGYSAHHYIAMIC